MLIDRSTLKEWRLVLLGLYFLALPFAYAFQAIAILMAIFGLGDILRGKVSWKKPVYHWLFILFALYWLPMLASLTQATDFDTSFESCLLALRFPLIGIFIIRSLKDRWFIGNLNIFIVFAVIFWLLDTAIQWALGEDTFNQVFNNMLSGPFDKNSLGLWLMLLILPFFSSLKDVFGVKGSRIVMPVFAALYLLILTFTNDLHAYLAIACWLIIALLPIIRSGYRLVPIALGLSLCLIVQFFYSHTLTPQNAYTAWQHNYEQAMEWHGYENLDGSFSKNKKRSLTGVGARGMQEEFPEYTNADLPVTEQNSFLKRPMQFLEIRLETGWVGLISYLLMIIFIIYLSLRSGVQTYTGWLFASLILLFPLNQYTPFYGSYGSTALWIIISLNLVVDWHELQAKQKNKRHNT